MNSQDRRPVRIVTDSSADIPPEMAAALDIRVIPLRIEFGNKSYCDGVDLSGEEFYRKLRESATLPTTSQPSLGELQATYRDAVAAGCDVVSVHLSSGLSGTYNVACLAAEAEELPSGAVSVVDSQAISMCVGWLAIFGARAARAGAS